MKRAPLEEATHKIRNLTPLKIRQKIGPILGYLVYWYNLYLRPKNKIPKVLSIEQTIDLVLEKKLSVIRFGDGEISLIDGTDLMLQKRTDELSNRLEQIIKTNVEGLLICIPGMWGRLDIFADYAYYFVMHHLYRCGPVWDKLLSYDKVYGDTNMTRHYLGYKDKSNSGEIFKKIFSFWKNADAVLIEGSGSRLGVGNDMFDNAKSLKRILCPPENAYSKYNEIKNEAKKLGKDRLILLSLGPTAKVLAYDLFKDGYRVIDIGHIDMEYEMFLRKEIKQVKVPYKYFNEIHERNPAECTDEKYLNQIIATIK